LDLTILPVLEFVPMSKSSFHATDILNQMRDGAALHRSFGGKIELRLATGVVHVPVEIFDLLQDARRITPDGDGGFYRLA
jgi:hypothetical protein